MNIFLGPTDLAIEDGVYIVSKDGRVAFTETGGLAIKLINYTGFPSVRGMVVQTANDGYGSGSGFVKSETNSDHPMGVVYSNNVASGLEAWVVVSGVAQVLMQNGQAATAGYWVRTGAAGRVIMDTEPPGADVSHWLEVGHALQSHAPGIDVLVKVVLHFN